MCTSYKTRLSISPPFLFLTPVVELFLPIFKTLLCSFNIFVLDIQDYRKYGVRSNETD